jgi:predicted NBD/HSP70 family sugar kinase
VEVAVASPVRAREARWRSAVAVLDEVRRHPGATRAAVARRLGLTSGSAAEITARLRDLDLLAEAPVAGGRRGRPTSVLGPHPRGPLVLVVDLRQEDWRCAVAGLDGRPEPIATGRHATREPVAVLEAVHAVVHRGHAAYGDRVRAVGVAVAGTVRNGRLVQAATLGWDAVDLGALAADADVPLVVGNDARLAGVAEARSGAAVGAAASLHVTVEVGVGGALIVDGRPVTGATGAAGEFGHLPFGDPAQRCPCGARGCWDLDVDGRALARHLGAPPPVDPRTFARRVLASSDPVARAALARTATSLGAGVAGLVNALDPEVVTLGGLAEPLRAAAPDEFAAAFADGLMTFRRTSPPGVVPAAFGEDGALHGAAATALDQVVSEPGLAAWAASRG